MKRIFLMLTVLTGMALTSCSGTDYVNAIPGGSTALLAIDAPQMASQTRLGGKANIMMSLLKITDPADCGIDFTEKLYLFEAPDGNLGLVAKVSNDGKLDKWLNKLAQKGVAQKTTEKRGFRFSVLRDNWVIGFSPKAVLLMGPVLSNAQPALMLQMAKYLGQDEERGVKGTPMFEKLDSIKSGVAMVAQAQALPEKFVSLVMLGAPKDADASQVLVAAEMNVSGGCLLIDGETFSFNRRIDEALRNAAKVFRPVKGDYAGSMPADALMGLFVNVKGADFLKLLQQNKGLTALLAGINAAIDMDNIIRSVDGDMAIVVPTYGDQFDMSMAARLSGRAFVSDVDYWKQSCPQGGKIMDTGKDSWCYTNGQTTFHFGVTADNQFFSGSTAQIAAASVKAATQPLRESVRQQIPGKHMAVVISLRDIDNEVLRTATTLLEPLFGKLDAIVYSSKK